MNFQRHAILCFTLTFVMLACDDTKSPKKTSPTSESCSPVCEAPSDPCLEAYCDAGLCKERARPEGETCDDGDSCTGGDVCAKGVCAGPELTCACLVASDCLDDGNPCNGSYYCDLTGDKPACKISTASVVKCKSTDDVCNPRLCDPKDGLCHVAKAEDGTECDDDDPCTTQDSCADGTCSGPVDPKCACKSDSDCAPLEDDNLCNGSLYCDTQQSPPVCKLNPTSLVKCAASGTECAPNKCVPSTGKCALTPVKDDTPCDSDGFSCTVDKCKSGTCQAGPIKGACVCNSDVDCAAYDNGNVCDGSLYCNLASKTCLLNPASIVTCPSWGNTGCRENVCAPKTGTCSMVNVAKQTPCDDGYACTSKDACDGEGSCSLGKNVCQCQTSADCAQFQSADKCVAQLFCNKPLGVCQPNPATKPICTGATSTTCAVEACDPKSGKCKLQPLPNDTPCEADDTACTSIDRCKNGKCAVVENLCPCQNDTDCANQGGGDLCAPLFCNKVSKACEVNPSAKVICSEDGSVCAPVQCDPKDGKCKATPAPDGTFCEADDFFCTKESCQAGKCDVKTTVNLCHCWGDVDCENISGVSKCLGPLFCDKTMNGGKQPGCQKNPGKKVLCSPDEKTPCVIATCDPATGSCGPGGAEKDGKQCDDGSVCTTKDGCASGKCVGQAVPTAFCDDKVSCTVDACDPTKGCVHKPNGDLCNDSNPCTDGSCDPKSGCSQLPNQATCTDGSVCTVGDACDKGTCKTGPKKTCDDKNPCTKDSCDPTLGCIAKANGDATPCDDGDTCTINDVCKDKTCQSGGAKNCDDNNPCTTDSCGNGGVCSNVANTTPCDDGDKCTSNDVCKDKTCQPGVKKSCDDKNPCTTDSCGNGGVCSNVANTTPCDDGDKCTSNDVCKDKTCQPGVKKSCDDKNPCTTDSCGNGGVCSNVANTTPCDDGDKCTSNDVCKDKTCQSGVKKNCEDGNLCAMNWCVGGQCTSQGFGSADPKVSSLTKTSGKGYSTGTNAQTHTPMGILMMGDGYVYFADAANHVISRFEPSTQKVTTHAGVATESGSNTGKNGKLNFPVDLARDGDALVVTDAMNHRLVRIAEKNKITLMAGGNGEGSTDGAWNVAKMAQPYGVAVSDSGEVFFSEPGKHKVRKLTKTKQVLTVIGVNSPVGGGLKNGAANSALLKGPRGISFDSKGRLLIADSMNHSIRSFQNAQVTTIAGTGKAGYSDGALATAEFNTPSDVFVDPWDAVLVTDTNNHRIRLVMEQAVGTYAGIGPDPSGVPVSADGDACTYSEGSVCGSLAWPGDLAMLQTGALIITQMGFSGGNISKASNASGPNGLRQWQILVVCNPGNPCDEGFCNQKSCKTIGPKTCNDFNPCTADSCDAKTGKCVFSPMKNGLLCGAGKFCQKSSCQSPTCPNGILEPGEQCDDGGTPDPKKCSKTCQLPCAKESWTKTFVAGVATTSTTAKDGQGAAASFKIIAGMSPRPQGGVYVLDGGAHTLRSVDPSGNVKTLTGTKGKDVGKLSATGLEEPSGIATMPNGTVIVTDAANNRMLAINEKDDISSVFIPGANIVKDGPLASARVNYPTLVAADAAGAIIFIDAEGAILRRVEDAKVETILAGKNINQGGLMGCNPSGVLSLADIPHILCEGKGLYRFAGGSLTPLVTASASGPLKEAWGGAVSEKLAEFVIADKQNIIAVKSDKSTRTLLANNFIGATLVTTLSDGTVYVADQSRVLSKLSRGCDCLTKQDCLDANPCTTDECQAGSCVNTAMTQGSVCLPSKTPCKYGTCDKAGTCVSSNKDFFALFEDKLNATRSLERGLAYADGVYFVGRTVVQNNLTQAYFARMNRLTGALEKEHTFQAMGKDVPSGWKGHIRSGDEFVLAGESKPKGQLAARATLARLSTDGALAAKSSYWTSTMPNSRFNDVAVVGSAKDAKVVAVGSGADTNTLIVSCPSNFDVDTTCVESMVFGAQPLGAPNWKIEGTAVTAAHHMDAIVVGTTEEQGGTTGIKKARGWLARVNSSGSVIWQKLQQHDTKNCQLRDVTKLTGDYVAVGSCGAGSITDPTSQQAWVLRFDDEGKKLWSYVYTGVKGSMANGVAPTAGALSVVGTQTASTLAKRTYLGFAIQGTGHFSYALPLSNVSASIKEWNDTFPDPDVGLWALGAKGNKPWFSHGDSWGYAFCGGCNGKRLSECDDGKPCTFTRLCVNNVCKYEAISSGGLCLDGDACFGISTCDATGACSVKKKTCSDGNPCTLDSCTPNLGCSHAVSKDGTKCGASGQSTCKAGVCI